MKTSPSEFVKWLDCIPHDIATDLWYIPLRAKGKEPAVPKGQSWKDAKYRLSAEEVRQRLETGENYGVVFRGRLLAGDIDDVKRATELKLFSDALIDTLITKTRDGKLHLYFLNGGIENKDYSMDKMKILELRAIWRYVVGPGSWVPPTPGSGGDGLYRVVNAKPPKLLKPDMLPWLKPKTDYVDFALVDFKGEHMRLPCIKVLFEVKLTDGRKNIAGKLLGIAWALDYKSAEGFEPFAKKYVAAQATGERPIRWSYIFGRARSAVNNKLKWSCGEMINLLRSNEIFPPCSGCPLKEGS